MRRTRSFRRFWFAALLVMLPALRLAHMALNSVHSLPSIRHSSSRMPYALFLGDLEADKVARVSIASDTARAHLKSDSETYIVHLPHAWKNNRQLSSALAAATSRGTVLEVQG